jgi:hypothetical protein
MTTAPIPAPEEEYEATVRQVCAQCGHAFVWHGPAGYGPDGPPEGCGVRGCTCALADPSDL